MIFAFYQMISCIPRLETGFNWITYRIPKVGSRIIFQPSTFPRVSTRCWLPFREGVVNHPKKWNSKHFTTETGIFISPTNKIGMFWKHCHVSCHHSSAPSPIHLCNLCGHDVGSTTPTQNKAPQKIYQNFAIDSLLVWSPTKKCIKISWPPVLGICTPGLAGLAGLPVVFAKFLFVSQPIGEVRSTGSPANL